MKGWTSIIIVEKEWAIEFHCLSEGKEKGFRILFLKGEPQGGMNVVSGKEEDDSGMDRLHLDGKEVFLFQVRDYVSGVMYQDVLGQVLGQEQDG